MHWIKGRRPRVPAAAESCRVLPIPRSCSLALSLPLHSSFLSLTDYFNTGLRPDPLFGGIRHSIVCRNKSFFTYCVCEAERIMSLRPERWWEEKSERGEREGEIWSCVLAYSAEFAKQSLAAPSLTAGCVCSYVRCCLSLCVCASVHLTRSQSLHCLIMHFTGLFIRPNKLPPLIMFP